MKKILKYLLFILIGIIIYIVLNHQDGFSIGAPYCDLYPERELEISKDKPVIVNFCNQTPNVIPRNRRTQRLPERIQRRLSARSRSARR